MFFAKPWIDMDTLEVSEGGPLPKTSYNLAKAGDFLSPWFVNYMRDVEVRFWGAEC